MTLVRCLGFPRVDAAMILLTVAMLVIAACVAVPIYVTRQRARRIAIERELPPLIFSAMRRPTPATEPDGTPELVTFRAPDPAPVRAPDPAPARVPEPARAISTFAPPAAPPVEQQGVPTSDTVHFRRPTEEALQLLPGRLEVLSGLSIPREIRFVRVPGERPQLILGREPGGSPQDVTLPSNTVSRKHARLDFASGQWGVSNLSRTNPVVVNDETLSSTDGARVLADGDRIELGDVVLRFCAH